MNDNIQVWIRKRKLKKKCRCRGPCRCKEKHTYHLRWLDPATGGWRSKKIGTDRKVAEREAAVLEGQLQGGTFQDVRRIAWPDFIAEHVRLIQGSVHAQETERVLIDFGNVCNVTEPRHVRFTAIESYVQHLRGRGNAVASVNKALRYLRLSLNKAVQRGYVAKNPMSGWVWEKERKRQLRILTSAEEPILLASAEKLYGFKMRTFVRFLLESWARLSEATGLAWDDVDFGKSSVVFRDTKSHEDRYVPIAQNSGLLDDLRKLQAQTLRDGGPFATHGDRSNLSKKWKRVIEDAGIPPITIHDLRRTGISRALLGSMPSVVVQRLAGHKSITTTMRHYAEVSKRDLRDAVTKYRKVTAG